MEHRLRELHRLLTRVSLLVFLASGSSCTYARNRALDFTDTLSFGVSGGSGFGVRAEVTRGLSIDVSAQKDTYVFGWNRRCWAWQVSSFGLPFSPIWIPSLQGDPEPKRGVLDWFTTSRYRVRYGYGSGDLPDEDRRWTMFVWSGLRGQRWTDIFNVQITASALIAGIDLAIRPGELLDFLSGIVLLDPAGDDHREMETSGIEEQ